MKARSAMRRRVTAGMASAAVIAATGVAVVGSAPVAAGAKPQSACHLGNGVKHVVSIVFDNVHFFRDNPNVPSDLEQMPHLLNFLKSNGTVLSNVHTPLIAHTADDSLTIYTGLYGDRHGQPLSNSYKTYNPDGTTDPATSFAYWNAPVSDTASHADRRPRHHAEHGLLRHGAGHARRDRQADAGAVGAVHPRRLHGRRLLDGQHGAGERPARPARGVRPELARGRAVQRRPGLVQGRRDRRLHRRGRALREGRRDLRERAGGEVRPDHAVAERGRRTACRPSPAATTASRDCSAQSTSRRSSARARRT